MIVRRDNLKKPGKFIWSIGEIATGKSFILNDIAAVIRLSMELVPEDWNKLLNKPENILFNSDEVSAIVYGADSLLWDATLVEEHRLAKEIQRENPQVIPQLNHEHKPGQGYHGHEEGEDKQNYQITNPAIVKTMFKIYCQRMSQSMDMRGIHLAELGLGLNTERVLNGISLAPDLFAEVALSGDSSWINPENILGIINTYATEESKMLYNEKQEISNAPIESHPRTEEVVKITKESGFRRSKLEKLFQTRGIPIVSLRNENLRLEQDENVRILKEQTFWLELRRKVRDLLKPALPHIEERISDAVFIDMGVPLTPFYHNELHLGAGRYTKVFKTNLLPVGLLQEYNQYCKVKEKGFPVSRERG